MTDQASLPDKKEPRQLGTKAIQEKFRPYAVEALAVLVKEMREGDNSAARIGAAKTIIAKVLPDLKSTELTGEGGQAIRIVVEDYGSPKKEGNE